MRDYILTQSEIDSFHKNGFLVLENLYSNGKLVEKVDSF